MRQLVAGLLFVLPLASIAVAQVNPLPKLPPKPHPPAPRLAGGVPNLGPTEPNKGYWHLAQFQDYKQILIHPKEIPYQPWARALACSAAPSCRSTTRRATACRLGPAPDDDAVPDGDHPAARAEADRDDLRGRHTHLARDLHGRPPASQAGRVEPDLARALGRALGGRHPCGRCRGLQRGRLDRHGRRSAHRSPAHRRALYAEGSLHAALRGDHRRSGRVHRAWTIGFDIVWDEKGEIQEYICQENSPWMRRIFAEMLNVRPR